MFYNLKVFEYGNGDIQVRYYDEPMKSPEYNPCEKDKEVLYNPFYDRITDIRIYKEFPWEKKVTDEDRERYKQQSLNRTKHKIIEYARSYHWEWFCTMTFDEKKVDRYDYRECSKKLRVWLNNQKNSVAPDLKYVFVPEEHEKGGWHFHGLLADVGNISFVESGKYTKGVDGRKPIYNMDKYRFGFTTAIQVDNTSGISKYITKYITKDLCAATPNLQRYFVSQSLPKPRKTTFVVPAIELEEFLDELADSTGTSIYSCNKVESPWCGVTYYEMQ